MTDEKEIEKQSEEYVAHIPFSNLGLQLFCKDQIKQVFQDGAKWGMEQNGTTLEKTQQICQKMAQKS